MDTMVKSITSPSLSKAIFLPREGLTVMFLFGKVHFVNQKDRKLKKKDFVSQAIVLITEYIPKAL